MSPDGIPQVPGQRVVRALEKAGFVSRVIEHVEKAARNAYGGRGSDADHHVSDLRYRMESEKFFYVMLQQGRRNGKYYCQGTRRH